MAPHPKRSKAETAFVQLLLDVLRTVNDAISTATGPVSWSWGTGSTLADRGTGSRLLDAWPNMIRPSLRPPRVTPPRWGVDMFGGSWPALDGRYKGSRAVDRDYIQHLGAFMPWGQLAMWHGERGGIEYRPMRGYMTWGTIQ